jgi:hypothetical protein
MLEKDFKKKQQEDFKAIGWIVIQCVAGSGIPMGFPDTEFISPTGYHCFVEWKKMKSARRQPLQEYWNKKLNSMGHDAFFVYPENVEEWREQIISLSVTRGLLNEAR